MNIYKLYTDGSASTQEEKCGSYCAIIEEYSACRTFLKNSYMAAGSVFPTSIGKMELMAVNAGLALIVQNNHGIKSDYSVEIYCDSTYVSDCATGTKKRSANLPEWAMFDSIVRGMNVTIQQAPRNTIKAQAHCDGVAGEIRKLMEAKVDDLKYYV